MKTYHMYNAAKAKLMTVDAADIDTATSLLMGDSTNPLTLISDRTTQFLSTTGETFTICEDGFEGYDDDHDEPSIDRTTLNEIFDQHLGQSYDRSLEDNSGCSIGRRNGSWLSPQRVTKIVQDVLDNLGVTVIGEPTDEDEDK